MDIILVELVVAVLNKQAVKPASFRIEVINAVRLTSPVIQRQSRMIIKAVERLLQSLILHVKREITDIIAFLRDYAIIDLHLILLGLLEQKHFSIEITHVADTLPHIVASLNRPLAVINDWSFAKMPEETIEALRAVTARKTIYAERNLKDGKPLTVWALRHISLKLIRSNLLVFAANARSCQQITAFRNETGSTASTQNEEETEQEKWLYELFDGNHDAKVQKSLEFRV